MESASNRLISVEDLSDEDLEVLHAHYRKLALMAKEEAASRRPTPSRSESDASEKTCASSFPMLTRTQ